MKEMSISDWVWAELLGNMQIICESVLDQKREFVRDKRCNDAIYYICNTYMYTTGLILLYTLLTMGRNAEY